MSRKSSWALGWVAVKGKEISFNEEFLDVAVKLHSLLGGKLERLGNTFNLYLDKDFEVNEVNYDLLRGVFEAGGVFGEGACFVPKVNTLNLSSLLSPFSPKESEEGFFLTGEGMNLFLHTLYDFETQERAEYFFNKFLNFITGSSWERKVFYYSLEEGAFSPFKKRISDSGFDLFLIRLIKKEGNLYFFDTGVRVSPPPGFYFDLVPRSSIYKSGFILANSVGIIDMTYRGTIKVPLVKVKEGAPEPTLPWRAVQLIPRRFYPLEMVKVEELDSTLRGEGGFGSTG